jgi:hypothetical protein
LRPQPLQVRRHRWLLWLHPVVSGWIRGRLRGRERGGVRGEEGG